MFARKLKLSALTVAAVLAFGVMGSKVAVAANQYVVEFRATAWKVAHFDDAKRADAFYEALTKLGCQTKKGSHGGHSDVSYVCPQWRRIALKNHDEAHQWEKWFKASGFETKHVH